MVRFLLVAATLLFSSVAALAQGNSSGALEISCWKREEGQQVACGPSPLQMERRFQIGSADFTHVGYITIINRTNKVRAIEVGEISPAYDPDDAQQPFWFGDVQKRLLHLRPGAKLRLKPAFVGRKRATRSYDPRPWVAPGTYEGTLIVRDKTGGDELRFTMTVFAYKPGGN
jgi:hypothetical protein